MSKPKLRILDIAAFVLTIVATLAHIGGFAVPNWWSYDSTTTSEKETVGMIQSTKCDISGTCVDKIATVIEGGKEWLFITRVFEVFGLILCLIAVIVQIVFLPTRNYTVRSAAIYTLGAAGLFILAGSILFGVMNRELGTNLPPDAQGTLGPGFGISIAAGLLTLVACIVTGVATVRKGDDYYD